MKKETCISGDEENSKVFVDQSPIHGDGLFAAESLNSGELIGFYKGPQVAEDGMHVLWIQEDDETWIGYDGTGQLRYMNHSDSPNAEMYERECYALSDISVDEEITIDYGWNEP